MIGGGWGCGMGMHMRHLGERNGFYRAAKERFLMGASRNSCLQVQTGALRRGARAAEAAGVNFRGEPLCFFYCSQRGCQKNAS